MKPVYLMNQTAFLRKCGCGHEWNTTEDDYSYWPDHLWSGKVSASINCPKCGLHCGVWVHQLPGDWDAIKLWKQWEQYQLPRLLFSAQMHNIRPNPGPKVDGPVVRVIRSVLLWLLNRLP